MSVLCPPHMPPGRTGFSAGPPQGPCCCSRSERLGGVLQLPQLLRHPLPTLSVRTPPPPAWPPAGAWSQAATPTKGSGKEASSGPFFVSRPMSVGLTLISTGSAQEPETRAPLCWAGSLLRYCYCPGQHNGACPAPEGMLPLSTAAVSPRRRWRGRGDRLGLAGRMRHPRQRFPEDTHSTAKWWGVGFEGSGTEGAVTSWGPGLLPGAPPEVPLWPHAAAHVSRPLSAQAMGGHSPFPSGHLLGRPESEALGPCVSPSTPGSDHPANMAAGLLVDRTPHSQRVLRNSSPLPAVAPTSDPHGC